MSHPQKENIQYNNPKFSDSFSSLFTIQEEEYVTYDDDVIESCTNRPLPRSNSFHEIQEKTTHIHFLLTHSELESTRQELHQAQRGLQRCETVICKLKRLLLEKDELISQLLLEIELMEAEDNYLPKDATGSTRKEDGYHMETEDNTLNPFIILDQSKKDDCLFNTADGILELGRDATSPCDISFLQLQDDATVITTSTLDWETSLPISPSSYCKGYPRSHTFVNLDTHEVQHPKTCFSSLFGSKIASKNSNKDVDDPKHEKIRNNCMSTIQSRCYYYDSCHHNEQRLYSHASRVSPSLTPTSDSHPIRGTKNESSSTLKSCLLHWITGSNRNSNRNSEKNKRVPKDRIPLCIQRTES